MCRSLFYNKVAGLRPTTFLKRRLCEFCENSKNIFFYRTPPMVVSNIGTLEKLEELSGKHYHRKKEELGTTCGFFES